MSNIVYKTPVLEDISVPDLFTLVAKENPRRDAIRIIREHSDAPIDSVTITWERLLQEAQSAASDLIAQWADKLFHESPGDIHTAKSRSPGTALVVVGILAANRYEYLVNMIACTLNRWTPLLISPRNSPSAIEHLLRVSKANLFLVDLAFLKYAEIVKVILPEICILLFATSNSSSAPPPVIPLTPKEAQIELDLPAFYLHTSGSTGHPKVIPWSHRFIVDGAQSQQKIDPSIKGKFYYTVAPMFHALGMIIVSSWTALGNILVFVSSPKPKPPSADALLSHIPFMKGATVALPPAILEELYRLGSEAVRTVAENTNLVFFSGALLNKATGDALRKDGINLTSGYGSTEIHSGSFLALRRPEDWEYISFRRGYTYHFLPVEGSPNLRELVVGPGKHTPAVINHQDPYGYATNDIWEPHPTEPDLWRYNSRKGDVTVLGNGEKTDNKQLENLLMDNRHIQYVQVFGSGRTMNGVLLQPSPATQFSTPFEFLENIQPTIERANSIIPQHSKLVPELILVATLSKPFAVTDKNTVKRKETLDKYTAEIDVAYASLESGKGNSGWSFKGDASNSEHVREFLRPVVKELLSKDIPDSGDLFEHGMDSLLAMRLRLAVITVMKTAQITPDSVPRNVAYIYPTIDELVAFMAKRDSISTSKASQERIRSMIAKFSVNVAPHRPNFCSPRGSGMVIALTGSTGSVGCSLLDLLLAREDVSRIYLLNRKGTIPQKERLLSAFNERGLVSDVLTEKENILAYVDVDLSLGDLGIPHGQYVEIRNSVTHIFHVAWHLNFNLALQSYERVHVAGIRHLIDLALASPHVQTPRLVFLSSIAAVAASRNPVIREEPIDDPSITLNQGYGQGKYVGERLLTEAVEAGLRTTIIRVGQLSGVTSNGAWNSSESIPILFRSSIELGAMPDDLPNVRWIPSDIAAKAILKQALGSSANLEYFHVDNEVPTRWKGIAQAVSNSVSKPIRLISFKSWLSLVSGPDVDPERVPAARLLEFYHDMANYKESVLLDLERSVKAAPDLNYGHIPPELIQKYVTYQLQLGVL